jgi:hypothetical protein
LTFNQFDLVKATPFLQALLAQYSFSHVFVLLKVNKGMYLILTGKPLGYIIFVLPGTLCQITRHADVKRAIFTTGYNVNARMLHNIYSIGFRGMDSRIRGNDEPEGGNDELEGGNDDIGDPF